ncbi:MAG TPA: WYL domain-containing protein [Candidatus Gastranaerophilaceae bacterium]|nr:WYL domain-containing protein [Candidatus Gastranaerophilaceae bacterium]
MQEFLTNNTVNCNLMSLTGYRTLVILGLLMDSPKSPDEINQHFFKNQYIKETFSNDMLRIYINSLREAGCEITRASKTTNNKYVLVSHPFDFDLPEIQLSAIQKLYKSIYEKIEVKQAVEIENLFKKIEMLIKTTKTKEFLANCSIFKNTDKYLIEDLLLHCKNKNQIVIIYKSPRKIEKEIEIIADKLSFKSDKLYLWGHSLTHGEYSYFKVENILKILTIKLKKEKINNKVTRIIYEVYNPATNNYIIEQNEKIIEKNDKKLVIEKLCENKFETIQKLLYLAKDCKIISPQEIKNEVKNILKSMEKTYKND